MSLVGTRPILQDELLKYELHHRARIAIKPGITVNFYKGDCVFVPADSEVLTIHGQAQFLDIRG